MIRFATALRAHPPTWLAPPLTLFGVVYAQLYGPATRDGYALALTASGGITVDFIAPVCAALAAWEAGRLRRAAWWGHPHVRSRLTIALVALAPVFVAGWLALAASIGASLLSAGLVLPDARVAVVAATVIVAHSLVGFVVGLWLPVVAAAPLALMASWLWMALPRAVEPLWLRHLNGDFSSCCILQADLSRDAVIAALIVALGFVGAAVMVLTSRSRASSFGVAAVLPIVGLTVGSSLVSDLGPDPATPRDPALLVCSSGPPPLACVWPEHTERLTEVADLVSAADAAWRAAGVPGRNRYSEADGSLGFSNESTKADIIAGIAYGRLPPWPDCAATEPYLAGVVADYVHAWLAATAGMADGELRTRFDFSALPGYPSVLDLVTELREEPSDVQRRWYETNIAALETCTLPAELDVPT